MVPSFWLRWRKQFEEYGVEPNLANYHREMITSLNGVTQTECNIVAKSLNQALSSLASDNDDWYKKLGEVVKQSSKFSGVQVYPSFAVKLDEVSKAWSAYYQAASKFNKIPVELQTAQDINDLNVAKHLALQLQGKINKFKGQVLETFLTGLQDTFTTVASNAATNIVNDLTKNFAEGISSAKTNFSTINNTEGELHTDDLQILIDDEKFILRGAQQKVDVTLPSPFKPEEKWRISAKNYSTLRNIHLLSNSSFLRLIYSGIQQNNDIFKFLLNALTIPSANWLTPERFSSLKKILMIEAISGNQINNMANVMVITINDRKNPFRIISIPALLNRIFEDGNLNAILFDPVLEATLPMGDTGPRTSADIEAIKNLKISAVLSKAVLTLSYLSQLAKSENF